MRKTLLIAVATWGMLGAFSEAHAQHSPKRRTHTNTTRSNTYSPNYGYSVGGMGNGYGNSAPYQGNFRFAPGYGYGSIYGNSGHPGYRRQTGPAWNNPAAWGY